jgi:serine/threonine protein kinase
VALKVLGVARALSALHREKVVHRDVKEPNILVRASDEEAVLVDFGGAGGEQLRRVTRDVLPPGTPEYRPPEAWRYFREYARGGQGHYEPGPGDDVYALGVVLYWLLTGRLPCEGATLEELIEATLHQVPVVPRELNPRVPQALSAVCMKRSTSSSSKAGSCCLRVSPWWGGSASAGSRSPPPCCGWWHQSEWCQPSASS